MNWLEHSLQHFMQAVDLCLYLPSGRADLDHLAQGEIEGIVVRHHVLTQDRQCDDMQVVLVGAVRVILFAGLVLTGVLLVVALPLGPLIMSVRPGGVVTNVFALLGSGPQVVEQRPLVLFTPGGERA